MNIVFLGTPRLAQIVLANLISSDYNPSLVITGKDSKTGRGLSAKSSLVNSEAKKQHLKVNHDLDKIDKSFDLAILVAFGHIIPKDILIKPKHGFINVHPSLLPKYRGPSPIQSTILNGDKKTGVSIIKLDNEIDHGPILAQKEIEIEKNDTHESLIEKTGVIGSNLLIETLTDYLSGKLKPKEQNHNVSTLTKKITKKDGEINIDNLPHSKSLIRMINAYYPWPSVWTKTNLNGKEKIIKFLPQGMIQVEGKKPMTTEEFLNGYPQLNGKLDIFKH